MKNNNNLLQTDKNFVYKGKIYPIDFVLLTRRSQFFRNHQKEYDNITNIEIYDNGIDIPEDSINSFISFCQFEQNDLKITELNVYPLRHLAIKYEVPGIVELTSNYIASNNENLALQSLHFNLQHNLPDSTDEDFISTHFFDYINDSKLLQLPVPVIYRLLRKSKFSKINNLDDEHQNQLFDFLFKCLDEHKKQASILFSDIEIKDLRSNVIHLLLNEYASIFDFNMINSKNSLKMVYEMLGEINKMKFEQQSFLLDVKNKFEKLQAQIDDLTKIVGLQKSEISDLKKTVSLQKSEISDLKTSNNLKMDNIIASIKEKVADLKQNAVIDKNAIEQEISKMNNEIQNNKNFIEQQKNMQQYFITKDHLRRILQAGRDKTRNVTFWVEYKTWTNPDGFWSNGPVCMGDNLVNWGDGQKHLNWETFQPWDAAIASI